MTLLKYMPNIGCLRQICIKPCVYVYVLAFISFRWLFSRQSHNFYASLPNTSKDPHKIALKTRLITLQNMCMYVCTHVADTAAQRTETSPNIHIHTQVQMPTFSISLLLTNLTSNFQSLSHTNQHITQPNSDASTHLHRYLVSATFPRHTHTHKRCQAHIIANTMQHNHCSQSSSHTSVPSQFAWF